MTVREQEIRARRFEFDENNRKLRDLTGLRVHIESSLDRIAVGPKSVHGDGGSLEERRVKLQESLADIDKQIAETEAVLEEARAFLEESENVRDGYDRVPVAIGKGRGRGQVEHIRIVRAQRG
jgi:chromosome segregation ATPase